MKDVGGGGGGGGQLKRKKKKGGIFKFKIIFLTKKKITVGIWHIIYSNGLGSQNNICIIKE